LTHCCLGVFYFTGTEVINQNTLVWIEIIIKFAITIFWELISNYLTLKVLIMKILKLYTGGHGHISKAFKNKPRKSIFIILD